VKPDSAFLQKLAFGGGASSSAFSPIALVLVLLASILICVLPRNKAIWPFFLAAILIPMNQVLVIDGLHFPMLKILGLAGLLRVLLAKVTTKDDIFSGGINCIDKAMIVLTIFTAIDGILVWRVWGMVVAELGQIYTPFGIYFLLRFLIRDEEDTKQTLRVWACVAVANAAVMICEHLTGRNPVYAMLGGASASNLEAATLRINGLRAKGTFLHEILAGTFGGMSLPLFFGLWWKQKQGRIWAAFGAASSIIIALTAATSTALISLIAAIIGLCCWFMRRHMRAIRWGIVGLIVGLQFVMKAPVWSLINRINIIGDASGWHRYQLVDQCIRHFWDWALIGSRDYGTWGANMFDLSNQYVLVADTVGLIPLISFLAIIVFGFKYLGRARHVAEVKGNKENELFIWAMSAALFANVIAMIGIDYFDQTMVAWYAILAMISAVTLPARRAGLERAAIKSAKPNLVLNPWLAPASSRNQRSD